MLPGKFTIEEVNDPEEIARSRAVQEQGQRNLDWLAAHWPDLLPQAVGKYVAVAGQEAFIASSVTEAWDAAVAAHPEDQGIFIQFVRPGRGPCIYANSR